MAIHDPDPITNAILEWCARAEAARGIGSSHGRISLMEELGIANLAKPRPGDSENRTLRSAVAGRAVRYCSDLQKRVLRARYWPADPNIRQEVKETAGGEVVIAQTALWAPWSFVARACGIATPRQAKTICTTARQWVAQALDEDRSRRRG